jgi:hypothetical protein
LVAALPQKLFGSLGGSNLESASRALRFKGDLIPDSVYTTVFTEEEYVIVAMVFIFRRR